MRNRLLVARHQFLKEATKRSFILVLLSMPLFVAVTVGFGMLSVRLQEGGSERLGLVDTAGVVDFAAEAGDDIMVERFESADSAAAALEAGGIDGYLLLPVEYPDSYAAELVHAGDPPWSAYHLVEEALRQQLLAGLPADAAERVVEGPNVTIRGVDGSRTFSTAGPNAGDVLVPVLALMLTFLVLTTGGYMMTVLVEEKENRTMELMLSSITPDEMMSGKIMGALAITAVQFVVWLFFLLAGLWYGINVLEVGWLQNITPNWRGVGLLIPVGLSGYFMIAALMTLVGSTLVESQEAQQLGGLFFLPLFLPVYLVAPIIENTNGPVAVIMTLLPFTSIMTLALRTLLVDVPLWQGVVATLVSGTIGLGLVWLSGRVLRLSMLRYGKRLSLREVFARKPEPAPEPRRKAEVLT